MKQVLKTDVEKLYSFWNTSTLALIQSGGLGAQNHIANGLTALFTACGQDIACVAESSVGLTRMEILKTGDLYVSLTLPNLIVGTIGGGTILPTQKECLKILGCYGKDKAKKLAEICISLCLSGEISIASALSSNQFTQAQSKLAR